MANARRIVVGITGPVGSGATTVSKLLQVNGFERISLSTAIKDELRKRESTGGATPIEKPSADWRYKLQALGDELRQKDKAHWVKVALPAQLKDADYVVDSIRNVEEVRELRTRFRYFFLLAVVASKGARWRRLSKAYEGNEGLFERDDERDHDEELEYGQQVSDCVLRADYVFMNEQECPTESVWTEKISTRLMPKIEMMQGKRVEDPSSDESYMEMAYAQSHISRCLKRHVGAVIVGSNGFSLSAGYNENPVSMMACKDEYGYCYKDEDMKMKLTAMGEIYCMFCCHKQTLVKPWTCQNCGKDLKTELFRSRNMELCTAIHAEERAIRTLGDRSAHGATMFVTTFPCFQCARYILDAGIKRVVYLEPYPVKEAIDFLGKKIIVQPFEGFTSRAFGQIFDRTR